MTDTTPAKYKAILDSIKELEAQKKAARSSLIDYMDQNSKYTHADETHEVKLSRRMKVKYDNEGILDMLASKYNLSEDQYTERKLDLTKLEGLIADGIVSAEDVADYATVEEQSAITVKAVKK